MSRPGAPRPVGPVGRCRLGLFASLLVAACGGDAGGGAGGADPGALVDLELEVPVPQAPVPADWASAVGPAPAPGGAYGSPDGARGSAPGRLAARGAAPAALADGDYDDDRAERVRRLVYRVSFVVPPAFRHARRAIRPVSGELHLDVAHDRLRATFVGPGWPIHDGAQVRLRADVPGVYVFDGDGGRWLGPGQMAMWFEGKPVGTVRSSVRIRREFGKLDADGPGVLVCALLAEWTNQPREQLEPRCRGGSLPPGFRFGPWRAEITAVVPMELPRRALRADQADPPLPIAAPTGAPVLAEAERARLEPRRGDPDAPLGQLWLENTSPTRLIIIAQGIPVAWLDSGRKLRLDGLMPGMYRIGAIRPFGILNQAPRSETVPGTLSFGRGVDRWRRRAAEKAAPDAGLPDAGR